MKTMKILVSVIIPVRVATPYLRETIAHLRRQAEVGFELLVVTDEKEVIHGAKAVSSGSPGPALKRNLGARKAKGQILAFLDDDSYPDKNWLKNAIGVFAEDKDIVAVCGPCVTPPADTINQKASGWVWGSWLGSGGAGTYRNRILAKREVDDFPSVNLLVKKKYFLQAGGFDEKHWPGEDTKLCLDLVIKLKKKIVYDPGVLVFHHRRPVFAPHLKQISRYAKRRGFFARKYPQTSFRIGYLMPTLFISGLIVGGLFSLFYPEARFYYIIVIFLYLSLLFLSGIEVLLKERNLYLALLVLLSIPATHVWYGLLFPLGFFQKDMGVVPHEVDKKKKKYIGG